MKQKLQRIFPKNNLKLSLLNGAYVLFLLSLLYQLIVQFLATYGYESWGISEYLINYQGGFVRRGLLGEILFFFTKNFNFDIEWAIKIFCLAWFVLVCMFFVKSFLKKGYSLYILPLCFFLGVHILNLDGAFWLKRDHLMFCFLIAILWGINKTNKKIIKFLIINSLTIIVLLIHESFAFLALPILFVLLLNEYKNKHILHSIVLSLAFLLPCICTFFLILHYHGDIQTAQTIWDSWVAVANFNAAELDNFSHGAISSIGWTSKWAFNFHFSSNFLITQFGVWSTVFWSMTILTVYYIVTNALLVFKKNEIIFTNKDKTILSSILVFQIVCLFPFFLALSCDLGRIIFYWVASSFVIFLLIPTDRIGTIFPRFLIKFAEQANKFLANIIYPTKTTITLLMMFIGIPPVGFYFISVIESSMIYNVLFVLSQILIELKVKAVLTMLLDLILNLV